MPNADIQVPPILPGILGAKPARMGRRTFALGLDTVLACAVAMVILTAFVYPQNYPNYQEIMRVQGQAVLDQMRSAVATGKYADLKVSDEYLDFISTTVTTLFLVLTVYFSASELLMRGATLGKRVFGLRAARWGTAGPPLVLESLSRSIFKATCLIWPVLLVADFLPVFFRSTRRAGHDYLARTIVTGSPLPVPTRRPDADDHD